MFKIQKYIYLIILALSSIQAFSQNYEVGKMVYINTSYLDSIHKYQSSAQFNNFNEFLFGFNIEDSNHTIYGFTKHEGGIDCPFKFIGKSAKFTSLPNSSISLEGEFLKSDAVRISFQNQWILFSPYQSIETAIRQQFFSGKFVDQNYREFNFNPWNGHVAGFGPGNSYYEIVYDFALGIDFDCILLFSSTDGGNWNDATFYHFKVIDSNTIELYSVKTDFKEFNHVISAHAITLTRK